MNGSGWRTAPPSARETEFHAQTPARPSDRWGRGRSAAVRVLAAVGLVTFSFLLVLVTFDALGRTGEAAVLEPPGSIEARLGAEHPGEAVHVAGALAALAIGASGLIGLIVRPRSAGFATQAGGAALGALAVVLVMGDPDNYGGQAGPVDVAFLVMALPVLAAAATAVPWRQWRRGRFARPRLLVLAALGLPAVAFGVQQALIQRRTWPPLADPHHQSHWYAMAVLGLMAVPVVAGAALTGRGWHTAPALVGLAAVAVAGTSLATPTAGSALHPAWAIATLLWGLALLAATFTPSPEADSRRPPER